jgi:ABC-type antimicrobial peptide transport system permease subunit
LTWALDNFAWGNERFLASLFTVFALLALTLAAAGLYSVVSYAAARRTQEIGLRMALGATRANVVRLVLGSSLTMVAIGAAAGLAISIVMAHWMGNLVGGSSRNPVTLILVGCVLMFVAAIACAVPAWRATTINPMRALREE